MRKILFIIALATCLLVPYKTLAQEALTSAIDIEEVFGDFVSSWRCETVSMWTKARNTTVLQTRNTFTLSLSILINDCNGGSSRRNFTAVEKRQSQLVMSPVAEEAVLDLRNIELTEEGSIIPCRITGKIKWKLSGELLPGDGNSSDNIMVYGNAQGETKTEVAITCNGDTWRVHKKGVVSDYTDTVIWRGFVVNIGD